MISSINFSVKKFVSCVICLSLLLLSAGIKHPEVSAQDTPVTFRVLTSDKLPPQTAMTTIRWTAEGSGGTEPYMYDFYVYDGSALKHAQSGSSPDWNWTPAGPGSYRFRIIIRDSLGNYADSRWSPAYEILPKLQVEQAVPDRPAPQAAETATIRWTAKSTGGIGARAYEFHTLRGTEEKIRQTGSSPDWDWTPAEAGTYRIKVIVKDARGNTADSGWSPDYRIEPKLQVEQPVPDRPAPQAAEMTTIRWTAAAKGGVGDRAYEFHVRKDTGEEVHQTEPSPELDWTPIEAGKYRVKAIVKDARGNTADSGWSPDYRIAPKLQVEQPVPDRPAPQAAKMTTVRWTATATGGVGPYAYEFLAAKGSEEQTVQRGTVPYCDWKPLEEGIYRIKVIVKDSLGNTADSGWSNDYEIVPELLVQLMPDRHSPRVINTPVLWTAHATGGVGDYTYEFDFLKGTIESTSQKGPLPDWSWTPGETGTYRIKVIVRDTLGNTADSGWSEDYEIVPELVFKELVPDRPAPQAALMTTIRWTAKATGGVPGNSYEFYTLKGSEEKVHQTGPSAEWDWTPTEAGTYRIKVIITDALGNTVNSGWSPDYRIEPELKFQEIVPNRPAPQAAKMTTIRWTARATGGVGMLSYEFHTLKDSEESVHQSGPSAEWDWKPTEAGMYRVKVVVKDTLGNAVDSGWSPDYRIEPELQVAVSPDRPSPQAAKMTTIRWTAEATGGVGAYYYEFHMIRYSKPAVSLLIDDTGKQGEKDGSPPDQSGPSQILKPGYDKGGTVVQKGPSSEWDLTPMEAGVYRVNVVVTDELGNTVESGWSPEYRIEPELQIGETVYDKAPPQVAKMITIRWTAAATGGVGAYTYEFHSLRESAETLEQSGPSSSWDWAPIREGRYRIKVVVRDSLGNTAENDWSPEYEIAPPLVVEQPAPDKLSPQAVNLSSIWWFVKATGGVGEHMFEFYLLSDSQEHLVQKGASPDWNWAPRKSGHYKVRAVVRDALGNTVDSGWSSDYEVSTFTKIYDPIAVLPVANISRQMAPLDAIEQSMKAMLTEQGLIVQNDDVLENFMAKHRIRYTSGLDRERAQEFREERVAGAVLITSLEHYDERYPAKIALSSRLVSTKEYPEILWMDSIGLAGDDSPELLGLGLVKDPRMLLRKCIRHLSDSLALFLSGGRNGVDPAKKGWLEESRFDPRVYHRAPFSIDNDQGYTVAVLPFFNRSDTKYAGEILELHFVQEMEKLRNFKVSEPGTVRDSLLKLRVIMFGGISLDNAQSIFSMLNVDYILTGTVIDYKDYVGPNGKPKVDFSALLIDRRSREAVWTSKSYNEGDEDVYFFDYGKVNTAHAMASDMVSAVVKKMVIK